MNHGPLTRYVKLWVTHAPGMPGTFSPPPLVSDPAMHHGTCVTHVPWCMSGSLTRGGGDSVPDIPAILCIWQEAREMWWNVAQIVNTFLLKFHECIVCSWMKYFKDHFPMYDKHNQDKNKWWYPSHILCNWWQSLHHKNVIISRVIISSQHLN